MQARLLLLVMLASGVGGAVRYVLSGWTSLQNHPTGTLTVNVLGCFLIGLLLFGGLSGGWLSPSMRTVLGVGLLGGFTTMSTFTYETIALLEAGAATTAALNVLLTVVLCFAATVAGRAIGLSVWAASA